MSENKKLVISLKIQIDPNGIPRPLMDFLHRTAPNAENLKNEGILNLISLCNDIGLNVMIVITRPGGSA